MSKILNLELNNTFLNELQADVLDTNVSRQVSEAHYSIAIPKKPANPKLIITSEEVAKLIGIEKEQIQSEEFLNVFSGASLIENSTPYAMCYGGHQFGHWAGQLGDGRAINLAEVKFDNKNWAIQLKGAGKTPYSRTADGLAVLRSSIREYLCSEAMYHLGVPTTRALSLCLSGDQVLRDVMYDGNPAYEHGAIVCRVAPSFVRFGSFELLSSRRDEKNLQLLADYTIKNYYPQFEESVAKYTDFFGEVASKTLEMIIHWQRVGFVHGVMNTDNMSILGLTIDYGPYGWQDNYDPDWTPNTTDAQNKRYRFGNQAQVALWNLVQLANAIYPLVKESNAFEEILDNWKKSYHKEYLQMMALKIGLSSNKKSDINLISDLEENLSLIETDMTIFFRLLSDFDEQALPEKGVELVLDAFYQKGDLSNVIQQQWIQWFSDYSIRLKEESSVHADRKLKMDSINPKFVLRNYMAQLVIDDAEKDDYRLLFELEEMLKTPYLDQLKHEKWFSKRPDWARSKIGCSALSCSS
jgi:serine/tyrosine/threonine adenylyltransferase